MGNSMSVDNVNDVVIIELEIPQSQQILLQSILQGEDGIGVIRSFDHCDGRQQFWTTASRRQDAYDWLDSLPDTIGCRVTGEWLWQNDTAKSH